MRATGEPSSRIPTLLIWRMIFDPWQASAKGPRAPQPSRSMYETLDDAGSKAASDSRQMQRWSAVHFEATA